MELLFIIVSKDPSKKGLSGVSFKSIYANDFVFVKEKQCEYI